MEWITLRAGELWEWLVALPPDFAFLLSLPFVVALTGLLAELARRRPAAHALPVARLKGLKKGV